jgi:hypothetical protein
MNPASARFSVPLRNARTGEYRAVTVLLPRPAQLEVLEIIAYRGIKSSAWPRANMRAVQTACARLPEYEWNGDPITATAPPELHSYRTTAPQTRRVRGSRPPRVWWGQGK